MTFERSRRREDWRPGRPFLLPGDPEGSAWHLPVPTIDLGEMPDPDREDNRHFGEAYSAKQEGMRRRFRDDDDEVNRDLFAQCGVILGIVEDLLLRNYRLDPVEVRGLCLVIPRDVANGKLWRGLVRHALGVGPRTVERWHRLAMLSRSGATGIVYAEDAADLAEMLSVPPFIVEDGRMIPLPSFPAREDWVDERLDGGAENGPDLPSSTQAYFMVLGGLGGL